MCWVWISQTKLIKVKFIAKQAPTHFRLLIAAVRLYSCDVTYYPLEMSEANLGHTWMSHEKEKDLLSPPSRVPCCLRYCVPVKVTRRSLDTVVKYLAYIDISVE